MSEADGTSARRWWVQGAAGVGRALDALPGSVAVGLGAVLGVVLVAATRGEWLWVAAVGVLAGWVAGRRASGRPKAVGWGGPAVGTVVLVSVAAGMGVVALRRMPVEAVGEREEGVAAEVEPMRWDLGEAGTGPVGSTGGREETRGSDDTGTAAGDSTSSGGDETSAGPPPPEPARVRVRRPVVEPTEGGGSTGTDAPTSGEAPDGPTCPSGMVPIEGGSFDGHDIEPFCLDITEVKVSSYERCMADRKCSEADTSEWCNHEKEGRGSHPINCVDWEQAKAFCARAGKRLPTQWEWEWAARGRDEARTYPWGEEEPTCERAVMWQGGAGCGKDRTSHVGSKPKGNSRDGVKDMAGNVWEWTSSQDGVERVVRGGSWIFVNPDFFRASYRLSYHPTYRLDGVGFRCARTAGGSK